MKVKVVTEHYGLPIGSKIEVTKELKKHYKGLWPSMYGTYIVKAKKKFCIIVE